MRMGHAFLKHSWKAPQRPELCSSFIRNDLCTDLCWCYAPFTKCAPSFPPSQIIMFVPKPRNSSVHGRCSIYTSVQTTILNYRKDNCNAHRRRIWVPAYLITIWSCDVVGGDVTDWGYREMIFRTIFVLLNIRFWDVLWVRPTGVWT